LETLAWAAILNPPLSDKARSQNSHGGKQRFELGPGNHRGTLLHKSCRM